jgi:orotate phosphoribosyltransferase
MRAFKKATDPNKPFKIKEVYSAHRKFFRDFMVFNREDDRHLFNAVEGQRVILVDDYKTSGTTIKEMMRQLSDAGAAEVVVFILLKIGE